MSHQELKDIIKAYDSMTVAFSGGVDSTLLAKVGQEVLGDKLLLIFINSPFFTKREVEFVRFWTTENKMRMMELELDPMTYDDIARNDIKRCYYCKKVAMAELQRVSMEHDMTIIADGLNMDDFGDYRPGIQASDELGLKHPFVEARFTKQMIRDLSRSYNLPNADRPASACLASRIPYDTRLNYQDLKLVETAEAYLYDLGFDGCRVRKFGDTAKLELHEKDFESILEIREDVVSVLKQKGFKEVYLDLQPYRMGSLTPEELL